MNDNFRKSPYLQRYEYVSVELDKPIAFPQANQPQKNTGYIFSIDNTSEANPFYWYNAFIKVDFEVQKLADGTAFGAADNISTVNSIYSLFKKVSIDFNGLVLNPSDDINHCCYIKNLLDFSKPYKNEASNSFDYPDLDDETDAAYRGDNFANWYADMTASHTLVTSFQKRHQKIITLQTVQALLSLNRYGFFKSLKYQICPQGKAKLTIDIETSSNFLFGDGADDGRVVVMKMVLYVPQLIFNEDGQ